MELLFPRQRYKAGTTPVAAAVKSGIVPLMRSALINEQLSSIPPSEVASGSPRVKYLSYIDVDLFRNCGRQDRRGLLCVLWACDEF
jgi:hypothetical protein